MTMRISVKYFSNARKSIMELTSYMFLCTEVYKTVNNLNSSFMKDFFKLRKVSRLVRDACKMILDIPKIDQETFGTRSLRAYGLKIWNTLPFDINISLQKTHTCGFQDYFSFSCFLATFCYF